MSGFSRSDFDALCLAGTASIAIDLTIHTTLGGTSNNLHKRMNIQKHLVSRSIPIESQSRPS